MFTQILIGCYVLGVGALGWSYIQNGVFLAWDKRPWWRATVETLLWPVALPLLSFAGWWMDQE